MGSLLGVLIGALAGYAIGRWHVLARSGVSGRNLDVENAGEAAVRRLLLTEFNDPAYHLLNNITIPVEDGTTQIDHILVSRYGVFVIETKHYSGWIFGDAKSSSWTRVKYRAKSRFQNPLHQNYKHLKVVQGLLHFLPAEHIHSLVVFTGDATFKTDRPSGVVHLGGLPGAIRQHELVIMEESTLQFCLGRIEFYRFYISGVTDAEHQAYLNRKFGDPMESGVQQRGRAEAPKASPWG